jgi:RNA polymerase sigma-70 factor (ECF subfamily)
MDAAAALEPDAQLMLRVKDGDADSFAMLLERHRAPVVHFLYRMVQNQAVAEELAQEVFFRVYRARASYQPTAKFTTWLFRIATHLALNSLRDRKGEPGESAAVPEVPDRSPTAEQELLKEARLVEVRRAIQGLPDKQRAAVLMHKYHGLEYTQIARALGCSESAVKSLLFRAYETLRGRLAHLA